MSAADWATVANLATALGTLVLAVATFSAVRSANLMARVAQQQALIEVMQRRLSAAERRLSEAAMPADVRAELTDIARFITARDF